MFKNINGHSNIKEIWKRAIDSNRIGHAYLLTGPDGIGKYLTAKSFAASLLLKSLPDVIKNISENNHPDVMQVQPDNGTIKVDTIREVIRYLRISPVVSERKIVVINDAHLMTANAANSLLRILEEPPSMRHLFIVTDRPQLLPATVRSRCQKLIFFPLSDGDLMKTLLELKLSEKEIERIVPYAEGSITKAFVLRDEIIQEAEGLIEKEGNTLTDVLEYAQEWNDRSRSDGFGEDMLLALGGLCRKGWRTSLENGTVDDKWIKRWEAISKTFTWWNTSANKQLLFEELLIKLNDLNWEFYK